MAEFELIQGDSLELLPALAITGRTFDVAITDPPYGIGSWDWRKDRARLADWHTRWAAGVYELLPPGGHLLMFGGTATYPRMACAVEDAGFEIRDTLAWLYGNGMPKTSPNDDGFAPGLKPAHEPIGVFRKPFKGSARACYEERGTSMLNVDACRIPTDDRLGGGDEGDRSRMHNEYFESPWMKDSEACARHAERTRANVAKAERLGRFPANVVLDEEAAAALDAQTGSLKAGGSVEGGKYDTMKDRPAYADAGVRTEWKSHGDAGGASKFYYCAKASSRERSNGLQEKNRHPTVKPVALMRWLVRLATPLCGRVLDPFAGSGATGIAAGLEGFDFTGIELDPGYAQIARDRYQYWVS